MAKWLEALEAYEEQGFKEVVGKKSNPRILKWAHGVGKAERRNSLDSQMKECRKVAAALGKLTRFSSRGREMSARDLENCNRAAAQ